MKAARGIRILISATLVTGSLLATRAAERSYELKEVAIPNTPSPPVSPQEIPHMKIRLIVDGKVLTATLYDNAAARDFVSMLPLSLVLEDYAATEKVAYLPHKLDTAGAPAGFAPSAGDIAYYAPWGNLALFHKDFSYSSGLISLGRIESGIELLKTPGRLKARIEIAAD